MKIQQLSQPSKNIFNQKQSIEGGSFSNMLKDAIHQVNEYELNAQKLGNLAATGEIENIHEVMVAEQKSEIALQFAFEVKNKVLDAYKEIMRLQI